MSGIISFNFVMLPLGFLFCVLTPFKTNLVDLSQKINLITEYQSRPLAFISLTQSGLGINPRQLNTLNLIISLSTPVVTVPSHHHHRQRKYKKLYPAFCQFVSAEERNKSMWLSIFRNRYPELGLWKFRNAEPLRL